MGVSDIEVDACPGCRGIWFDAGEVKFLLNDEGTPGTLLPLGTELRPLAAPGVAKRRCPRCGRRMKHLHAPGSDRLILDCCPEGDGLWFDDGELEALIDPARPRDDGALQRVREFLEEYRRPTATSDEGSA